ncbi:MBL fold metallo-hydrolase [Seongchinamella sediminis]|uniref:MBL fold metallo-hydrolase n=1 Tax=Seongchinamella sediminis TaxID=2283635 RepID=A0A3L7E0M6_9GAMM|nr:MBL fold metallo-hydrolase [Seongchinamella sediminis]RLQ21943.1 MBL fold metallo-hydrolase [Seongchinamella sediminis]
MRFASLGSGSKGNATVVQAGATTLMIDCGFSLRETTRRLQRLGLSPEQLQGVLVTHEHSDHCAGVARLSARHAIPVYLTHGTAASGRLDGAHRLHCFNADDELVIGDFRVQTVTVPHDAAEPCQFRLNANGRSLGILTDLGCITPHVVGSYRDCHSLVLEFNHDVDMLQAGEYPPQLKRRVGGDWGHLNNLQAAELLRQLDRRERLNHLVVAHVSEKNNSRACAELALDPVLDAMDAVVWADQQDGFDWLPV